MPDIAINWNSATATGDWAVENGDLLTGSALVSAVMISLFTDQRAPSGTALPDNSGDPRGHWSDTYTGHEIGSWLWLYRRGKKAANTNLPMDFQNAAANALQWLIDDQVAATVTITTGWMNATAIGMRIVIAEPDGTVTPFNFQWAWNGI